ncbi:hypothetical protein [Haloferula sp.]|uniref:hypothetical protein n=1 Tax=Haloferula sp. TaxID=2497595 RepID=UPI00329EF58E
MTRDKDLRRWGRLSAVLLVFLGCFLLCAVYYSYDLVHSRLEPTMQASRDAERKVVERISDEKIQAALAAGVESDWQGSKHLLDGARSVILGGGIGFAMISFYAAALSWRAYELASASLEESTEQTQAEQAGDCDA